MSNQFPVLIHTTLCTQQADNVFGPIVNDCRHNLDFTLLFEQCIFSILPASFFLLIAPVKIYGLWKKDVKIVPDLLMTAKLAIAGILAALQLMLLVSWSLPTSSPTKASIPSAALNLAVALEVIVLSYLEHYRSIKPSSVLNFYLLATIPLDAIQLRTVYMQDNRALIGPRLLAMIASKIALLMLEAQEKRSSLKISYQGLSPESTSGILNRSFLWWLNGLFIEGSRRLILLQDLYGLDPPLATNPLGRKMQIKWDQRSRPEGRFALFWAIYRCHHLSLLNIIIPRLCQIAFNFAQPFLITAILDVLEKSDTEKSRYEGYGLIALTALVYIGKALSVLHYEHGLYRFMTMFRGATVTLIYNRTLSLQPGTYDESAAITLQSSDVDTIADCLDNFNEIWARLLEVAIAIFLLARQLGWTCITPLVVVGLSTGGSSIVARYIGDRRKIWMGAIQRRVAITSSLLSEMKAVKMMGLGKTMTSVVQTERIRETELQKGYRWMIVWLNVVANIPWTWAPAATFVVYSIQAALRGSDHLNTNQTFTSLAIISLLTEPAARLLAALPRASSGMGCFDRIQKFLLAPSRIDKRSCSEVPMSSALNRTSDDSKNPTFGSVRTESHSEPEIGHGSTESSGNHLGDLAILVKAADIRPAQDSEIVLHNISLCVNRQSVVIVVGPVGAGKSTLLRALLGEVSCSRGHISVMTKHMAYCAQTPWLPNSTLQEAIRGPLEAPIDDKWYHAVIHACALNQDIASLPNGHQTRIGSRGVILSGGQKQRIALARALYSRSEVFILDDVLSALDKRTERNVVNRILGPDGLIRKLGSTVVMVTHATQYLPLADRIVILSASGKIVQQGSYEEIKKDNSIIRTLQQEEAESENSEKDIKAEDSKAQSSDKESDEAAQDLTRQTGDMAIYRYYFSSIGIVHLSLFLFLTMVNVFCSAFSQIWLKWWTDIDGGQVGLYSIIYLLLALFNTLSLIGYIWAIFVLIVPSTARKLHLRLLETVMRAPQSLFTNTETGSLLNRFSQDMTLIEGQLPAGVLVFTSNLFASLADTALISIGSTWMALTIPAVVIIVYVLQHVYLRTSRQLRFLDLETRSPVYSHFLETLDGLSTIQAFGWEKVSKDVSVKRLDASQKPYYLLFCIQVWLGLVLNLIAAAMAVTVVSLALNLRSSTSAGLLGVSMNSVLMFNNSLTQFVHGWTMLETSLGAIARLRNFEADTAIEAKEGEDGEPLSDWPAKGAIEFQNLTASHNPSETALHDITLKISPGQKIGICGRTGSGKSSLLATILRILEIDSGTLFIDDVDLSTIPRETIRQRLITMPQDPIHLTGSIRLNADPSLTATDDQVIAAFTKVRLLETLRERSPGNNTTDVARDGNPAAIDLDADINMHTLSQGQQQLFALGRAILKHNLDLNAGRGSKVLLLDEATSSVDTETDQVMQRVIREEFAGVTILTVAHRVETVMDADRVVVLEGGKVVEIGVPGELVAREGSAFGKLVGRQAN